jgi:hypothetical protein
VRIRIHDTEFIRTKDPLNVNVFFFCRQGGSGGGFKSKEFVEDDDSDSGDSDKEKKSSDKSDAEMDSASADEKSD